MRTTNFLLLIVSLLFLQACSSSTEEGERAMQAYIATADSVAVTEGGDMAYLNNDARKVIRKADIRCRVENVPQAVAHLERFATLAEGFVQESHTSNNIISEKSSPYKSDSLKIATVYRTTAELVIRIPAYALDTLATAVANISSFTDHRNMTRDDVTLQFLSNLMKNRAATAGKQPAAPDPKSAPQLAAQQYKDEKQETTVDRRIANLAMQDDTRYATLAIDLYQPEQVSVMVTQDTDKLIAATYGEKIGNALGFSIDIIKGLILAIISTWPVWTGLGLLLLWWKRLGKKKKNASPVVS